MFWILNQLRSPEKEKEMAVYKFRYKQKSDLLYLDNVTKDNLTCKDLDYYMHSLCGIDTLGRFFRDFKEGRQFL